MLRPLTPMAPGTHRYRATFAIWEAATTASCASTSTTATSGRPTRQSARRLAQQEIRKVAGYEPSWRIRQVARVDGAAARAARDAALSEPPARRPLITGGGRFATAGGWRCAPPATGLLAEVAAALPDDADRAVRAADAAWPAWAALPPSGRARRWRPTPTWSTPSSRSSPSWSTARPASPSARRRPRWPGRPR